MTYNDFIEDLTKFCGEEVPVILGRLQELRFKNQGQFNDNPKWQDNDDRVIDDKGFNSPLYDTGELFNQLTNPRNWKTKIRADKNSLTISLPDEESFTDSKYDVLDSGGFVEPWAGHGGKIKPKIKEVPARPFKKISAEDVRWIRGELVIALKGRYFNG